jgi:hypothetical protein
MSGSVTGYQAGIETTDVQLSYIPETTWGTAPNAAAQAIRITGESLTGQKQRQRDNEITGSLRVSPAFTAQESASGAINFLLSYGTFDHLFAMALGGDWSSALAINGSAGDISTVATGNKLTSTTAGKFTAIAVGQWIRLLGFTASSGANNGYYRVSAKTSDQDITLAGKTVSNETPSGTAAQVRGAMLRNADLRKAAFFQKRFASDIFLRYPGLMISGMTLRGAVGQSFSGNFTCSAKEELSATAAAGDGNINAAPTGGFFDSVANFAGVQMEDAALTAVVNAVEINLTRQGAGMDYGMGSAAAQGARWGQVEVNGTLELYFRDFTEYAFFKSEAQKRISWRARDKDNNAYIFTLGGMNLMNPQVTAGGPNQPTMARFTVEGGNDLTLPALQIDRFAGP